MDVLVDVEARIDFEEDLGPLNTAGVRSEVARLQGEIEAALRTARQGALLRNGLQARGGGGGGGRARGRGQALLRVRPLFAMAGLATHNSRPVMPCAPF
jgi:hypothetical protein